MQLEEFYNYKNQLIGDILGNETIVSLMTDDEETRNKPELLVYSQIFPHEYIPETVEHGAVFICCDVDIQQSANKPFLKPTLYVWVFAHKSKLKLPGGGVRTDKICAELAKTINGSRYYGLGELELYAVRRFAPMNDYQGKAMTFNAVDYNRPSQPSKPAPSNRRLGV
jgi:hypothetical protein